MGKILGLRQTKKGVKIVATAGRCLSQKVGANQVTAEGGDSLAAKSGSAYIKYHATMHERRWVSKKVAPPDRQDLGFKKN